MTLTYLQLFYITWVNFSDWAYVSKSGISLHTLAKVLGGEKSKLVLKIHLVSVRDTTSKIGTKAAAIKKTLEKYVQLLGEGTDIDVL